MSFLQSPGLLRRPAVGALLGAGLFLAAGIAAAEPIEPFADLPKQYGPTVVTVSYLIQLNMPGVNQELDRKVRCLTIDPSGLILCSNVEMGGSFRVMARLFGRSPDPISSRPRDLRVQIDGEEEEWPARLIARDSDRDLAWLQLTDVPEGKTFPAVDLEQSAEPRVGDEIFLLRRLSEYFGDEPVVANVLVAAHLDRPRPLFLTAQSVGYLGMPAFDAEGRIVGTFVAQVPRDGEGEPAMQTRGLPGQASDVQDMISRLVLPASELIKATKLARETWEADQSEAVQ